MLRLYGFLSVWSTVLGRTVLECNTGAINATCGVTCITPSGSVKDLELSLINFST